MYIIFNYLPISTLHMLHTDTVMFELETIMMISFDFTCNFYENTLIIMEVCDTEFCDKLLIFFLLF